MLDRLAFVVAVLLSGVGLYVLVADRNLLRKVVGLNVFQTGIFLFFVVSAVRDGGRAPLLSNPPPYVNPLPHVLILTAIVVGVSVTGVALALLVRIDDAFGTLDERRLRDRLATGPSGEDDESVSPERSLGRGGAERD